MTKTTIGTTSGTIEVDVTLLSAKEETSLPGYDVWRMKSEEARSEKWGLCASGDSMQDILTSPKRRPFLDTYNAENLSSSAFQFFSTQKYEPITPRSVVSDPRYDDDDGDGDEYQSSDDETDEKKKKVSRELSVQDSIGFLQTLNTITSLANTVTQAATSAKKYVMHSLDERDEEDVPRFPIIRYLVVGDAIEINAHNDDDDDNDRKLNGKEICDVERERESSTKEISKPSKNYTNPAERLTNDRDSTSTVERRSSFNTSFKRKKKRDSSCQPKVIAQKSKKKITASSDDIDLHRPSQFGLQSYDDALALTDFVSAFVEMLQSGFRLVQHESPDKPAYLIILSLSSDCSNLCWNICASSNKYNNDNQQHQLFVQNFGSSSQRTKRRIADARVLNDPPKFKLRRPTSNCFALTFSPKSERVAGLAPREIYVFESKNADTKALLVDGLNLLLDKALYKFFNSSNTFRIPKKMNSNSTTSESAKKVTSSPKNTVDDDANKSTSHNSAKTPPVSLISANSGTKDVEAISPHFSLTSSSSAKEQRQGLETPKLLDNNISSKPTVFLFQQKVEDKTPSIDIYVSSSTTS